MLRRSGLAVAFVVAAVPAVAADENWTNVKPIVHGKTKFYDFNEPVRRIEREQNAQALAVVRGDEKFEKLAQAAVWYPERRLGWQDIAIGGPYESPWMYGACVNSLQQLRARRKPEPLPPDMRVQLARRYVKYKQKLAEAKALGAEPRMEKDPVTGAFRLSATMTEVREAKSELIELAGEDAVKQLELELYPPSPAQAPSAVPAQRDAFDVGD